RVVHLGGGEDLPCRSADAGQTAEPPRASALDSRVTFDADVIVAGAGPAGAVAARTLAASGRKTLLSDRATLPGNKTGGGGLTLRASRRFPWLKNVLGDIDVHRVSTLHLDSPNGSRLTVESPEAVGLLIRRIEFDHALVRGAQKAGAQLR